MATRILQQQWMIIFTKQVKLLRNLHHYSSLSSHHCSSSLSKCCPVRRHQSFLQTSSQQNHLSCHQHLSTHTESEAKESQDDDWVFTSDFHPELNLDNFDSKVKEIERNVSHRKGDADVQHIVSL